jgi:CBS domain-containing protein
MGLREDIMNEKVAQLPLRRAVIVSANTSVGESILMMRDHKLGCVFVVDEHGRATGKFTERQVLKLVCGCVSMDETVGKHMAPIPEHGSVRLTDPVLKVLEGMRKTRLRFLCVVDDTGKVVSLAGQKGLMEYVTERFPRQIKVQMMTSKMHMSTREGA